MDETQQTRIQSLNHGKLSKSIECLEKINMTKKTYEMQEDALHQLEDIKTILKLSALTEAVNKSIAIAHRIIDEKSKGNDILINKKPFDFFGI